MTETSMTTHENKIIWGGANWDFLLRFAKYKTESNSVNGFIKKIRSEPHITNTPNTSCWSGYRHHRHYPLRMQQARHANSLLLIFEIKALTGFISDML